jgi:glucose/mannose transport system substrate-binding protein
MTLRRSFLMTALALPLAIGGGFVTNAQAQGSTAEVLHFWVSGGESKAIKVIADAFTAGGGTWVDNAVAGGDAARAAAISRIQGGNPPTAMMWNVGSGIDELAAAGLLNDVTDVANAGGWQAVLPPVIWERMQHDGKVVAVPLNIHGENWLYWNNAVLAEAGITTPPTTWDAFFAAADAVKAKGKIPLALGGEAWQELLLYRAVVASTAGTDIYKKVFVDRDVASVTSEPMKKATEIFLRMKGYIDPGSPGRSWNDATSLVITGQAGFQVMGDWAKGEFTAANQKPGSEFGCSLPPGGNTGYIMAVDVFAFPKTDDPAQRSAQAELASVLMDPKVQTDFNLIKGSVPLRQDVSTADFDACGQEALKILSDPANQLPNASLALAGDIEGGIEEAITAAWNDPAATVDSTLAGLAAAIGANK